MAKIDDWHVIEPSNPTWVTVREWAEGSLESLREMRERPGADKHELDLLLGSINTLNDLLELPNVIKQHRKHEAVQGDDFGIPTPKGY